MLFVFSFLDSVVFGCAVLEFNAEALAREVSDYLAAKQLWRALLPLNLSVKELAVRVLNYLALSPDVKPVTWPCVKKK